MYAGSDSAQAMVYGPYDSTFGQGHHTAQFTLMVDNNSGTDVVATLDVATGLARNLLAQRQIHRNEFSAANQWQTFTLEFDNPCFDLLQGRVWWAGTVNTKFSQLTITAVNAAGVNVEWLVTDQLGTPRMIADQTGSMAGVKRHDYLPFGEELYAGVSGRTAQQGYTGDSVRQKFTGYEADGETGLNFAQARYHSPVQGRFTSADPLMASASVGNPQSLNRYAYVLNNPVNLTDPTGLVNSHGDSMYPWEEDHWGDIPWTDGSQQQQQPPQPQQPQQPQHPTVSQIANQHLKKTLMEKAIAKSPFNPAALAKSPMEQGVAIAQNRLATIQPCIDLFRNRNGLLSFNEIVNSHGILMSDFEYFNLETQSMDRLTNHPDIIAGFFKGKIYFNPVGALARNDLHDLFFQGLTLAEAYALMDIHETAHYTDDFPPDLSFTKSFDHSLRVRIFCFPDKPLWR